MIVAVVDTNILVSSVISDRGPLRRVFELWREARFTLVSSLGLLEEIGHVLRYPRIRQRYGLPESDILAFLHLLSTAATIVPPQTFPLRDLPGPSDAKLFSAALAGRAEYLVTGDLQLLELRDYAGIQVVSPADFVAIVERPR